MQKPILVVSIFSEYCRAKEENTLVKKNQSFGQIFKKQKKPGGNGIKLTDSKAKLAAGGALCGLVAVLLAIFGNPGNMAICIACFIRDTAGALGMHQAAVVQYARPEIIRDRAWGIYDFYCDEGVPLNGGIIADDPFCTWYDDHDRGAFVPRMPASYGTFVWLRGVLNAYVALIGLLRESQRGSLR